MRKILMPAVALSLIAAPTIAFAKSTTVSTTTTTSAAAPGKATKTVKVAKTTKVQTHKGKKTS